MPPIAHDLGKKKAPPERGQVSGAFGSDGGDMVLVAAVALYGLGLHAFSAGALDGGLDVAHLHDECGAVPVPEPEHPRRAPAKALETPLYVREFFGGCPALALTGGHFTHRKLV